MMLLTKIATSVLLLLAQGVWADYSSDDSAQSKPPAVHRVAVGPDGTLAFSPSSITAEVGDLVEFQFNPKNHSVVQSSFDKPCVPLAGRTKNGDTPFFSGFVPTEVSGNATFTIQINSTDPMWFYCSQGKHCQGGMVGVINAPAEGPKTLDAYKEAAQDVAKSDSPSQLASGILKTNAAIGISIPTFSPLLVSLLVAVAGAACNI